nr:MAG TPA: hypothetical protein [Caudoviricetes sp.]
MIRHSKFVSEFFLSKSIFLSDYLDFFPYSHIFTPLSSIIITQFG